MDGILMALAVIGGIVMVIASQWTKYEDRRNGNRSWHDTWDSWPHE